MATWETEVVHQVWNNETGERYEVGPDRDGLDLVELRAIDPVGKVDARVVMPKEVAEKLARAILGIEEPGFDKGKIPL